MGRLAVIGQGDCGVRDYPGPVSELSEPVFSPAAPRQPRRQVSGLAKSGVVLFVIGLLAVAVIMVLFATGSTELPLWLNLVAMLAPVGFGLGLIGIFLEARDSRRASALRSAGRSGPTSTATVQ